jgi:DNA-binding NarL/FixJ family response regulator
MSEKIRILIVDDQELFALGLKVVIESSSDRLQVVGVAQTGAEALSMVESTNPEIVLMDVRMPEMDGVDATRLIHDQHPEVRILILTTFDDDDYVHDSMKHGAIGYLLKDRPAEEILDCIFAVHRGILQIDPAVSDRLLNYHESTDPRTEEIEARLEWLTRRERDVLSCMMMARRIVEIASALGIAEQTVRNHIANIYSKLDIHDRLELIKYIRPIRRFLSRQK